MNHVVDQKLSTLMFQEKNPFPCFISVAVKKVDAKKYAILLRLHCNCLALKLF